MTTIAAVVISLPTPERQPLLLEAIQSVYDQTRPPDDMVVGLDFSQVGEVSNINRLITAVGCEWLAFLHDDDLWLPEHLAVCEKHMDTADVVVSRFELIGRPWSTIEPWHTNFEDLRFTNWIGSPSMVCVRAGLFGEWRGATPQYRWNDWSQYNLLLDRGARFVDTGQVTVKYRFGPWSNGSWEAQ
jgi:hypothetical protein